MYVLAKLSSADITAIVEQNLNLIEYFNSDKQCENKPLVDENGSIIQTGGLGFNENTRYIYIRLHRLKLN